MMIREAKERNEHQPRRKKEGEKSWTSAINALGGGAHLPPLTRAACGGGEPVNLTSVTPDDCPGQDSNTGPWVHSQGNWPRKPRRQ